MVLSYSFTILFSWLNSELAFPVYISLYNTYHQHLPPIEVHFPNPLNMPRMTANKEMLTLYKAGHDLPFTSIQTRVKLDNIVVGASFQTLQVWQAS